MLLPGGTQSPLKNYQIVPKSNYQNIIDVEAKQDEDADDSDEDDDEPSFYRRLMMLLVLFCSTIITWQSSSLPSFYGFTGVGA